jgi:hypothetical protein
MVVVVVHECWLTGWCQSVVGRCGGKLPPLCGSWVLVVLDVLIICFVTAIAVFGVVYVTADLFSRVLVPSLLSPFPPLEFATKC